MLNVEDMEVVSRERKDGSIHVRIVHRPTRTVATADHPHSYYSARMLALAQLRQKLKEKSNDPGEV